MKTNWLIILFVFISTNTFNASSIFEISSPSIKVERTKILAQKQGEIIQFVVNFSSCENLKQFKITPSIKGANEDSQISYTFDENLRKASLNYFYVMPENLANENTVTLTFTLEDAKRIITKTEIINVPKY